MIRAPYYLSNEQLSEDLFISWFRDFVTILTTKSIKRVQGSLNPVIISPPRLEIGRQPLKIHIHQNWQHANRYFLTMAAMMTSFPNDSLNKGSCGVSLMTIKIKMFHVPTYILVTAIF